MFGVFSDFHIRNEALIILTRVLAAETFKLCVSLRITVIQREFPHPRLFLLPRDSPHPEPGNMGIESRTPYVY